MDTEKKQYTHDKELIRAGAGDWLDRFAMENKHLIEAAGRKINTDNPTAKSAKTTKTTKAPADPAPKAKKEKTDTAPVAPESVAPVAPQAPAPESVAPVAPVAPQAPQVTPAEATPAEAPAAGAQSEEQVVSPEVAQETANATETSVSQSAEAPKVTVAPQTDDTSVQDKGAGEVAAQADLAQADLAQADPAPDTAASDTAAPDTAAPDTAAPVQIEKDKKEEITNGIEAIKKDKLIIDNISNPEITKLISILDGINNRLMAAQATTAISMRWLKVSQTPPPTKWLRVSQTPPPLQLNKNTIKMLNDLLKKLALNNTNGQFQKEIGKIQKWLQTNQVSLKPKNIHIKNEVVAELNKIITRLKTEITGFDTSITWLNKISAKDNRMAALSKEFSLCQNKARGLHKNIEKTVDFIKIDIKKGTQTANINNKQIKTAGFIDHIKGLFGKKDESLSLEFQTIVEFVGEVKGTLSLMQVSMRSIYEKIKEDEQSKLKSYVGIIQGAYNDFVKSFNSLILSFNKITGENIDTAQDDASNAQQINGSMNDQTRNIINNAMRNNPENPSGAVQDAISGGVPQTIANDTIYPMMNAPIPPSNNKMTLEACVAEMQEVIKANITKAAGDAGWAKNYDKFENIFAELNTLYNNILHPQTPGTP